MKFNIKHVFPPKEIYFKVFGINVELNEIYVSETEKTNE